MATSFMNSYGQRGSLLPLPANFASPVYQTSLSVRIPSHNERYRVEHSSIPSLGRHGFSVSQHASIYELRQYKPSLQACKASAKAHNNKDGMSNMQWLSKIFESGAEFLDANFLPAMLISAVIVGLLFPKVGLCAHGFGLSKWATFGVFLISGLSLRTSEIGGVIYAWAPLLFGVVSSLFITPLVAVLILRFTINPKEFVTGLALFSCMPTTLSSGVSLTQMAGANTALALSLTLISNFLGLFTIPLMISILVAPTLGVSVPAGSLVKSLVQTSLIPLVIGKVIRACASGFIDARRKQLSMLSTIFLVLVPWMQISHGRDLFLSVKMQNIVAVGTLGMVMHWIFLAWNSFIMFKCTGDEDLHQKKYNSWAIILTASQKTLPVAIAVIGCLGNSMGEPGLLVLPCLISHISQIVFDSFLVQRWIQDDLQKYQNFN
ncbi:hypothetical protein KP509_14G033300 [Ceratopteris richardii]|uniref:Sodium/metabolite cotransporter BASS4, chloroplastic n=1 Tax=Ceratopteris richardii TaxID=49495 RepID=A0A8T2T8F7_CERRI|nr:hypothetical protein KP509_14G033300 [Ceratopteris richardii]KAH7415231.1 hypothetical protein KP509_14G033300 [Ceratopteris richardii]